MKKFNKVNEFKNLKFRSVSYNKIECAVQLLKKLGYEEIHSDFSVYDAASHNGICAWDDGEITEGWLDDSDFKTVTIEGLKEMVGETNKCNNTLSNNFTVAWEQVFGEKFVDSVIKAVKQNKDSNMKNDTFTLERLLGCEVNLHGEIGYICDTYNCHGGVVHLLIDGCVISSKPSYLTFFTEDGDELTFDEYVNMYYGDRCT